MRRWYAILVQPLRADPVIKYLFGTRLRGHLCPLFSHKILRIALLFLRFCSFRGSQIYSPIRAPNRNFITGSALRKILRYHRYRLLTAMVNSFFYDSGVIFSPISLKKAVLRTLHFIDRLPPFYRWSATLSILTIEFALPPLAWKWRRFTRLNQGAQAASLKDWHESPFYIKRMILRTITSVCLPQVYSEPALLRRIGYGPTLSNRAAGKCAS